MKKKRLMALSLATVASVMGVGAVGISLGNGGLIAPAYAADHDASHTMVEKTFFAPTTTTTGERAHWHCNDCCKTSAEQARYSYVEKTHVSEADITLDKLVAADAPSADDDQIATINTGKFKYVDQGADGVDGKEGTSTPCWVEDGGKTAIYFSRSNKAGDPVNSGDNVNCSEFRFTVPESARKAESVSFSYKYEDWGTGVWNGGDNGAQPYGSHAMIQFKDGSYVGHDVTSTLEKDGEWHTMTLDYSGGATTSFSDLIFKFVDLRGYIMVSGLSYELAPVTVALKNVTADNSADGSATVEVGSLPDAPAAISGKRFLGWYDESGSKVTAVTSSTTALVAKWAQITANSNYATVETLVTYNTDSKIVCPDKSGIEERADGVTLQLQKSGVNSYDITLPAFDYNSAGRVDFILRQNYGSSHKHGVITAGDGTFAFSTVAKDEVAVYVVSDGKNASLYIEGNLITTYDEDVSSGKSGLSFNFQRESDCIYAVLKIGDFKRYTVDYTELLKTKAESLPDASSITDDTKAAAVSSYKDYVDFALVADSMMTTYEKNNYSAPSKISELRTALAGQTVEVLSIPSSGSGWTTANSLGFYSDSPYAVSCSNNSKHSTNYIGIDLQNGGYTETKTYYVDLPKINYAAYSKVTFYMYSAGGSCVIKADGNDWVSDANWPNGDWPCPITISTTNGVTKISTDSGKSAELSEEVANGTKALRFERTREATSTAGYDSIGISTMTATI